MQVKNGRVIIGFTFSKQEGHVTDFWTKELQIISAETAKALAINAALDHALYWKGDAKFIIEALMLNNWEKASKITKEIIKEARTKLSQFNMILARWISRHLIARAHKLVLNGFSNITRDDSCKYNPSLLLNDLTSHQATLF